MNQTIPVEAIKAAALFVAKDRGRWPMHCVELRHGTLIATDGRRMARFDWTPGADDVAPEKPVIIEAAALLQVAKVKHCHEVRVNRSMRALLSYMGRESLTRQDGPEFPYQPDEDTYPDCDGAFAQSKRNTPSDQPVRLDPAFVADAGKASGIVQAESYAPVMTWTFKGKCNATEFEAKGERVTLTGLLMPISS